MKRYDQGASAVEFAIVLPVLVLLVFGITTFGIVFARTHGMEAAAREGARTASLGRTVDATRVTDAVRSTTVPFIDVQDINVTISPVTSDWCEDTSSMVTVTVTVDPAEYALPIPLFRDVVTSYEASGTFRCEAPHE